MHKFFSVAALAAVTMLLNACGGSSFSAGSSGSSALSTIAVSSDTATIPADGSASATVTATAADGSGNPVAGIAVTFAASAGTLVTNQGTTDSSGKATATLSTGTALPGTSITVSASSGTVKGTATIAVAAAKQSVALQTSSPQVASDNTTPATITAFVKDANNNLVSGVVVHFTATSGGLVVNAPTAGGTPGTTDGSGAATATLSVGTDPSIRTITVTATAGGATSSIAINVVGTSISVSGPDSLVLASAGTYTVALTDAGKKAIASQAVTVSSSAGNTLSAGTVTTDASGHATFTLTGAKSGTDTLSVSALGASASKDVVISNQQFKFTAPAANSLVPISATATCTPNVPVTVNWQVSGAPVAVGTVVNFSSTRGTLSAATATTDASGNAQVLICATSAGPAHLSVSGAGVSAAQDISFVSTTPSAIDLQPSPSTIPITGQSTLTAIVRDARGNLVQGQTVDFTLVDVTGGSLSVASAVTDVQGIAQTVYTASNSASANNGVSVTAAVHGTPSINAQATLTVSGSPLHVILGTGNKLRETDAKTAYIMDWFVSVTDAGGNPVPNSAVSLTIHSALTPFYGYFKGAYCNTGKQWVPSTVGGACPVAPAVTPAPIPCLNEDVNLNGQLDTGEDFNNDTKLEPGEVALASPGVVHTAVDTMGGFQIGTSGFTVTYPENYGNWVQVTLTATATVQGTEGSTSTTFVLPVLGTYINDIQNSPPGAESPFGVQACNLAH